MPTGAKLLIADRHATVGLLAAGVTHELNNPLAVITANLEILAREIQLLRGNPSLDRFAADADEMIKDTREAAERIRAIIADLKIFARGQEDRIVEVDVEEVIESSLRLARVEIRQRARLSRAYGNVANVRSDEAKLGQLFLNLILHAIRSIGEGRAREHEIKLATSMRGGGHVVVELTHTGGEAPHANLDLEIVRTIAAGIGADVEEERPSGRGTLLRVVLPLDHLLVSP